VFGRFDAISDEKSELDEISSISTFADGAFRDQHYRGRFSPFGKIRATSSGLVCPIVSVTLWLWDGS
jgi:hypothetical protein